MGTLTPGATYIYERANGTIYAREFGKTERVVVGYDNDHIEQNRRFMSKWNDILCDAEHDAELKSMLERIEVYHALKKNTP